jgi:hypothetical protein
MMEIEDIFFNKLSKRCDKWKPYFYAYEKHLGKFKDKNSKLLEIGVQNGGSLEMWHHYFGENCSIYGVDIDEQCLNLKYDFDVDLSVGNQEDPTFWKEYTSKNGFFDVIIDDGGHTMKQQETSVISLFGKLNYGGVYIIEDTHTSYWDDYGGGLRREGSFIENMKFLVDLLHVKHIRSEIPNVSIMNAFHGLSSMTFYDSMVVLEKEIPRDFTRAINF